MRVVFASDLHGRADLYCDLETYALKQGAQCIVIGGDLLPTRVGSVSKLLLGQADF